MLPLVSFHPVTAGRKNKVATRFPCRMPWCGKLPHPACAHGLQNFRLVHQVVVVLLDLDGLIFVFQRFVEINLVREEVAGSLCHCHAGAGVVCPGRGISSGAQLARAVLVAQILRNCDALPC